MWVGVVGPSDGTPAAPEVPARRPGVPRPPGGHHLPCQHGGGATGAAVLQGTH